MQLNFKTLDSAMKIFNRTRLLHRRRSQQAEMVLDQSVMLLRNVKNC